MDDNWRTDEPEVGRWFTYRDNTVLRFIEKGIGEYPSGMIEPIGPHFKLMEWKYITTHEEERLKERVRELEESQRWRKWPDEKPEKPINIRGYLIEIESTAWKGMRDLKIGFFYESRWFLSDRLDPHSEVTKFVVGFMPMPKEKTEAGGAG